MGCGSGCSSGGCSPSGCGNSGHCSSGGCNRLNVYDWLSGMDHPYGQPVFDIVEVRFKGTRKEFFRNVNQLDLYPNEYIVVETTGGYDIGKVSLKGELVRLQMKKRGIKEDDAGIKKIFRKPNEAELEKMKEGREKEPEVMFKAREIIRELKLEMKLGDIEYQADKSKITFYYTADDRVDFRELIKVLAEQFKTRIEMRQIGARQEAGRIGGLGSCGRELCCTTWLTDFRSVSTSAARYQNLSLNPLKLAGQCGRLKCCLNYELDTYMDALKAFPNDVRYLMTQVGKLELAKTDIFKRIMYYSFVQSNDNSLIPLSIERVKHIKSLNEQGIHPEKAEDEQLLALLEADEDVDEEPEFEAVIEGDLNRFDKRKKKKKKKKPGADNEATPRPTAPAAAINPPKQQPNNAIKDNNLPNAKQEAKPEARRDNRDNRPNRNQDRPQGERKQNERQERPERVEKSEKPANTGNKPQNQQNQSAPARNENPQGGENNANNTENRNRNHRNRNRNHRNRGNKPNNPSTPEA